MIRKRSFTGLVLIALAFGSPELTAQEDTRSSGGTIPASEVPTTREETLPSVSSSSAPKPLLASDKPIPRCGGAISVFDSALKQDQAYQDLYGKIVKETEDHFSQLVEDFGKRIGTVGGTGSEEGKKLFAEFENRRAELIRARDDKLAGLKKYFTERHVIIKAAEDAYTSLITATNEQLQKDPSSQTRIMEEFQENMKRLFADRDEKLIALKAAYNSGASAGPDRGLEILTSKGPSFSADSREEKTLAEIQKKYRLTFTLTDSDSGLVVVSDSTGKEIARASSGEGEVFKLLLERVETALNINHKGQAADPVSSTPAVPVPATSSTNLQAELESREQAEIAAIEARHAARPIGSLNDWIVNETEKIWAIDQAHYTKERDLIAAAMTREFEALVAEFAAKIAGKTGTDHDALMREFEDKKTLMASLRDRKIEVLKWTYNERAGIFKVANGRYEQLNQDLDAKKITQEEFKKAADVIFQERDQQLQSTGTERERKMQEIR